MIRSAARIYGAEVNNRAEYVDEAYYNACLTIPSLFPDSDDVLSRVARSKRLPKPWQSVGARGVRNLAAQLTEVVIPIQGSFYKWELSPEIEGELADDPQAAEKRIDAEAKLALRERSGVKLLNASGARQKIDQAMRQLIVAGNSLVYMDQHGKIRVFKLNEYVAVRDAMGALIEVIICEVLSYATAPADLRAMYEKSPGAEKDADGVINPEAKITVYTQFSYAGKKINMRREVEGDTVPGSEASFDRDAPPIFCLRMSAIDGEHYGGAYVAEFAGDLQALEDISRSLVIATLNAAKLTPLISPNSVLTPRKLMAAKNGEPLVANGDDVTMLQQNKQADMQVADSHRLDLKRDLAAAFLMNSAIQRDAERVTAEEIRIMAEELERGLGGIYSILTQELQLPLAKRLDNALVRSGAVQKLPKDAVAPAIVTGLAALGRGQDLARIDAYLEQSAKAEQIVPGVVARIKPDQLAKRIAVGVGIDTAGLYYSEDEMEEAQQAEQQQALLQTAGAAGAESLGQAIGPKAVESMGQGQGAPPGTPPQ